MLFLYIHLKLMVLIFLFFCFFAEIKLVKNQVNMIHEYEKTLCLEFIF